MDKMDSLRSKYSPTAHFMFADRVPSTTDLQLFAPMTSPRSFMDVPSRADRPKIDVSSTRALTS